MIFPNSFPSFTVVPESAPLVRPSDQIVMNEVNIPCVLHKNITRNNGNNNNNNISSSSNNSSNNNNSNNNNNNNNNHNGNYNMSFDTDSDSCNTNSRSYLDEELNELEVVKGRCHQLLQLLEMKKMQRYLLIVSLYTQREKFKCLTKSQKNAGKVEVEDDLSRCIFRTKNATQSVVKTTTPHLEIHQRKQPCSTELLLHTQTNGNRRHVSSKQSNSMCSERHSNRPMSVDVEHMNVLKNMVNSLGEVADNLLSHSSMSWSLHSSIYFLGVGHCLAQRCGGSMRLIMMINAATNQRDALSFTSLWCWRSTEAVFRQHTTSTSISPRL